MQFDIPSLLVAVALANIFCAGARLLLWRMHSNIPGLGRWALAGAAGALSLFLIFFYGIKQWSSVLSLAQLFVVIGLMLVWDGFRRFIGKLSVSPKVIAGITLLVLIWIATAQLQDSIQLRAIGNTVLVAALSALIAYELLTVRKPTSLAMRVTGWIYAINAAVFLIRAILTDQSASPVGLLNPNGFAAFMLLWWLFITIAVTLGMVLMTSERLQLDLDSKANSDPLTGALNRRAFSLIAEKEMARSHRYGTPLSLLMMDLDKFKQINDQLGHEAGDAILRRFVTIAEGLLRDEGVFCRFGGEEFVALIPNASAEQALVAAERLRTTFATDSQILDKSGFATVSIGIAELEQEEKIESLLCRADVALYRAKEKGRNCCEVAKSSVSLQNL